MPKRSREPLELKGREIRFYQGDWDELASILAPVKLTPSAFIREMTRKHIRAIQAQANLLAANLEVSHELTNSIIGSIPPEGSESDEPDGTLLPGPAPSHRPAGG